MKDEDHKSPAEERRDGLELHNEGKHAHPHHMENNHDGAGRKHVSAPDAAPGETHGDGAAGNEKK